MQKAMATGDVVTVLSHCSVEVAICGQEELHQFVVVIPGHVECCTSHWLHQRQIFCLVKIAALCVSTAHIVSGSMQTTLGGQGDSCHLAGKSWDKTSTVTLASLGVAV